MTLFYRLSFIVSAAGTTIVEILTRVSKFADVAPQIGSFCPRDLFSEILCDHYERSRIKGAESDREKFGVADVSERMPEKGRDREGEYASVAGMYRWTGFYRINSPDKFQSAR